LNAASGRSYNLTSGKDENQDQSFSDRPAGVKRNSLRGPGGYTLNMTYSSPSFNIRKRPEVAAAAGTPPTGAAGAPAANNVDQLIQSLLSQGANPAMIQSLIASLTSQPGFTDGIAGGGAPVQPPSITRPQLSFSINAQNVLNNTRVNSYSGVLTSPLFGKPTSWAQGRAIYLSLNTRF
jgi:hypothetical protein